MTHRELATAAGLTLEQYQADRIEYLQCEGYDSEGREYPTLVEWVMRHQRRIYQPDANDLAVLACERGEICGAL